MSNKKKIKKLKARIKTLETIVFDLWTQSISETEPKNETPTNELGQSLTDIFPDVEATPKKNGMVYFFPDGEVFTTNDEIANRLMVQILDCESDEDFAVVVGAIKLEEDTLSSELLNTLYDIAEIEYMYFLREKGVI